MMKPSILLLLASGYLGAATVIIVPAPLEPSPPLAPGSTRLFQGVLDSASGVYAGEFTLSFDPAVIEVTQATPRLGDILVDGVIDNAAGTVTGIAFSFAGPGPGASGTDLVLFDFTVRGLAEGASTIVLAPLTLLDSSLQSISADATPGFVPVSTPIPEPAALPPLLTVLAIAIERSRRAAVRTP